MRRYRYQKKVSILLPSLHCFTETVCVVHYKTMDVYTAQHYGVQLCQCLSLKRHWNDDASSQDLTPCNFWLLPTLKRDMRGWFFKSDEEVIREIQKSLTRIPEAKFCKKRLKKSGSKGWNSVLRVGEDTSKKMVAIRIIPNARMTTCNHFQYSFSFLTFSHPFFDSGWWTSICKIVHISACISHKEVT